MALRDEMHSLTQDIIGSYPVRAQALADIRHAAQAELTAAQAQLRELDKTRQATTRQLHRDLARVSIDLNRADAQRQSEVHSWLNEIAADHAGAQQEWSNLNATLHAKRPVTTAVAAAPPSTPQKSSQVGGHSRKKSPTETGPA